MVQEKVPVSNVVECVVKGAPEPTIQTVKTLLDANVTLGEKQKEAEAKAQKSDARIAELQAQVDKLNGEL